jgi:hypothetical protein
MELIWNIKRKYGEMLFKRNMLQKIWGSHDDGYCDVFAQSKYCGARETAVAK